MTEPASPEPTLETHLARLEAVVAELEREDLELDAALKLFEEGVGHLRAARRILRESELRVEHLLAEAVDQVERADGADHDARDGE